MEAALELTRAILDKRLYGQRDTLVLPILYTARHSVELTLKLVIDRLHEFGMFPSARPNDHDIEGHYASLVARPIGDEAMRELLASLKPYVDSLAAIDGDGQMLRYPETQSGEKSMADRPLANIKRIQSGLDGMKAILDRMVVRIDEIRDERITGTYTQDLSRRDLAEIARSLPPRAQWKDEAFTVAKDGIKKRYGIGSNKFAEALNLIENHREFGAIIGIERVPLHLDAKALKLALEQWKLVHPPRENDGLGLDYFDTNRFDDMIASMKVAASVNTTLLAKLSIEQLSELQALFYLGTNNERSEHYERYLEHAAVAFRQNAKQSLDHIINKTNFQVSLVEGLRKIGCVELAEMAAKS